MPERRGHVPRHSEGSRALLLFVPVQIQLIGAAGGVPWASAGEGDRVTEPPPAASVSPTVITPTLLMLTPSAMMLRVAVEVSG